MTFQLLKPFSFYLHPVPCHLPSIVSQYIFSIYSFLHVPFTRVRIFFPLCCSIFISLRFINISVLSTTSMSIYSIPFPIHTHILVFWSPSSTFLPSNTAFAEKNPTNIFFRVVFFSCFPRRTLVYEVCNRCGLLAAKTQEKELISSVERECLLEVFCLNW